MRAKPHLIHLFMVPILTLLVCNPFSYWVFGLFNFGYGASWKSLGIATLLSYGLYLQLLRKHRHSHWLAWIGASAGAIALSFFLETALLWLVGMSLIFSLMRLAILEQSSSHLLKDLLAVAAGIGAAALLVVVSLPAALAAFFLVQVIYEMGWIGGAAFTGDRFTDGYRAADRVLKSLS